MEVDDVKAVWMVDDGGVPGTDQDTSANVCMVGQPRSNLTCIHIETDDRWKARGWAPPDFPMRVPIDIQGCLRQAMSRETTPDEGGWPGRQGSSIGGLAV